MPMHEGYIMQVVFLKPKRRCITCNQLINIIANKIFNLQFLNQKSKLKTLILFKKIVKFIDKKIHHYIYASI